MVMGGGTSFCYVFLGIYEKNPLPLSAVRAIHLWYYLLNVFYKLDRICLYVVKHVAHLCYFDCFFANIS